MYCEPKFRPGPLYSPLLLFALATIFDNQSPTWRHHSSSYFVGSSPKTWKQPILSLGSLRRKTIFRTGEIPPPPPHYFSSSALSAFLLRHFDTHHFSSNDCFLIGARTTSETYREHVLLTLIQPTKGLAWWWEGHAEEIADSGRRGQAGSVPFKITEK